jgi:hypothetical protein
MNDPYNYTGAHFDGATYNPSLDHIRLTGQLKRVYDVMSDGCWRSLQVLAYKAQAPEGSCSARLRDLRKDKFGAFQVDKKRLNDGLWLYQLIVEPQGRLF